MSGRTKMNSAGSTTPDRLAQYKSYGHDWRETYRKRCLKRLRESRDELYLKRRGMGGGDQPSDREGEKATNKFIKMLMSAELKALKQEEGMDCEMDLFDPSTGEIDTTLALIEEIQEEMKAEEAKLLAEYEIFQVSLEKEEAALTSAIEMLHTHPTCPVCTKNPLMEKSGVVFCKCGVRIDTEQDGITLDFVGQQLEDAKGLHECDGQPIFSVQDNYGITNLLMICQKCDFMYIII